MIEFRQKDFNLATRTAYRFRKGVSDLTHAVKNGLESSGRAEAIKRDIRVTTSSPTSPNTYRLKRQTIKDVRDVKNLPSRINDTANRIAVDPGLAVNQANTALLENPITVVSNIAGKAVMLDPTTHVVLKAAPIGTVGTVAEQIVKKKVPAYARFIKKISTAYNNSIAPSVRSTVNFATEFGKRVPL